MKPYYQDDAVTIYHGDCLADCPDADGGLGNYFVATVGGDVLITDPPYGISWRRGVNNARASKAHAGIANDQDTEARDAVLDTLRDMPGLVFGSFYAPFPKTFKQVLVWPKPADAGVVGATTGFRRDAEPVFIVGPWPVQTVQRSSILRSGAGGIAGVVIATGHPHTKPVALMADLILAAPPGVVLDPFMGSGTTLVAAKRLGRKAIGIELEERYCDIAAQRLSQEVLDFGMAA